jgi:hypothetical protein
LRVLLEEWAAEKGIPHEDLYKGLDTKRKEMMLSEIAHEASQADRLFLPKREITDQIEQLLREMLPDEKFIDGTAVLKSIEVQHGVLVERAEGIYSFSHLTLQEYLTAQYIDDHRQIETLVTEHLTDARWREVFLLVAGLMRGGADDLLLLMEKEAQKYINTPKLQALLRWAEQVTAGSESNLKPAAKRTLAITSARAIDLRMDSAGMFFRDFVHTEAYLNFIVQLAVELSHAETTAVTAAIDLAYELKEFKIFKNINFTVMIARLEVLKAKVPDDKQPFKVREAFCNQIVQTWLNGLNLSPEMLMLTKEEDQALDSYFFTNRLIVQCKQAAVRVSPKTWEAIEERMLLVPNN